MAVAPGAFFLSGAVAARANHVFAAFVLTVFVLWKYRPAFLAWMLWSLPPAVLFLTYNWVYNGSPLVFGYQNGVAPSLAWFRLDGWLGLFVSPSRGWLIYSPYFIFALLSLKDSNIRRRPIYLLCGLIVFLNVYLMSMFQNWDGGWGYGTRLLVDAMPFAGLLLIPALEQLRGIPRGGFWTLAAYSVAVQMMGLWDYGEHWHWHWDNLDYDVWNVAQSEPLYYLKQYWEMALRFASRVRG
jgi:hypothetical protein